MIPSTTLSLSSSAPPPAVQSVANRVHVIGPASSGPLNTPKATNKLGDLATAGYGPGVSLTGEIFTEAATNQKETGLPVFFTRSATSVPSVLGTLVKTPGAAPTPLTVYGQVKLPGTDHNGDLFFHALASGVSLTVQSGGALGYAIAGGKAITLTVPTTTAASAVASYWNGVAALTTLATISAHGTGASDAGTTLATAAFDDGTLTLTALDEGYSVEIIVSGNSTTLSHSWTGGGSKTLSIHLATDTHGEPTSTAADVVTNLGTDIVGKIAATAGGAGTGLVAALSVAALNFGSSAAASASGTPTDRYLVQVKVDRGGALGSSTVRFAVDEPNPEERSKLGTGNASMWFLGKRAGLAVQLVQQTGNNKALTHTFAAGLLLVQLATDSSGNPSTTATALRSYLGGFPQLVAAMRFNFEVGDGSGIMQAADKTLLTAPTLNWSSALLVPGSGIVALRDSRLDTGISLTFTGSLAANDQWEAESTLPTSSTADMLTALAAIAADPVNLGAIVVFASSLDRSGASLFDAQIQAILQTRQMIGIFTVRGIGEGVANETHDDWQSAVTLAWLGFVSTRGLLSKVAGEYVHVDPYTGRNMRRYWIWAAAGRASSCPYHQDLARTLETAGSGSIKRCLGLYHDEDSTPGLHDQGFITPRSAIERPGAKFITGSPTCADQLSDAGYSLIEYPRVMLVGLRIAKLRAFDLRASMFPTTTAPDSTGAPKGALTAAAAESIAQYLSKGVRDEWLRLKSDGSPSIGEFPEGVETVQVLRDNVFSTDRTIKFKLNGPLLSPAYYITIDGNAILN